MELFRMVKIPTEGRIKIRGDMYGPLLTPHLESLTDIKIMLTYGVEVIGFDPITEGEVKLTLENYTENAVTLRNACHIDPTAIKTKPLVDIIPVEEDPVEEDPKAEESEEDTATEEEPVLSTVSARTVESPKQLNQINNSEVAPTQQQKNKRK